MNPADEYKWGGQELKRKIARQMKSQLIPRPAPPCLQACMHSSDDARWVTRVKALISAQIREQYARRLLVDNVEGHTEMNLKSSKSPVFIRVVSNAGAVGVGLDIYAGCHPRTSLPNRGNVTRG